MIPGTNKPLKLEIGHLDFTVYEHREAGSAADFTCPNCGENLGVAISQWWKTKCSCGITWSLDIRITGKKE